MHTSHELSSDVFEYRVEGALVDRDEAVPPISIDDRLGVVMADPWDGLGAGNFVLSCVTAFYDRCRERADEFFEYPDYYTFQATADPADYLEFDIWPDHKQVSVPSDPEAILRAVNDRAIDVLLVPDGPPTTPNIAEETLNSARRRIDACFLYAPDGSLDDADVSVGLPHAVVAPWYRETVDALDEVPDGFTLDESGDGMLSQDVRRIGLDEALRRLPAAGSGRD